MWECMALLHNLTSLARSSPRSAPLLVTPTYVDQFRRQKKISILDASWFMPNSPRNPFQEFISKRIPGAQFLDLDQVASQHPLGLKHMMPSEVAFAQACGMCARLQPSSTERPPFRNFWNRTIITCSTVCHFLLDAFANRSLHIFSYDSPGIFSSPRALFMFRSFGHCDSSVLDGGLPAWLAQGLPMESGPPQAVTKTHYPVPRLDTQSLRSIILHPDGNSNLMSVLGYEQIVANSQLDLSETSAADFVLDARSHGRCAKPPPVPSPALRVLVVPPDS